MRASQSAALGLAWILAAIGPVAGQGRERSSEQAMALQEALVWSGHYEGTIDGRIQASTVTAIRGFQREIGNRPTGDLTPDETRELAKRATRLREEVGYKRYDDPETGIVIGMPLRLTPPSGTTKRGSRFVSGDRTVEIELFRFRPEQGSIRELYNRVQDGGPERRVTYKRLGQRWFVVSGTEGRLKFYTRARAEGSGVAAFAIAYDSSLSETVEPVIVAMSSSFAHPDVLSLRTLNPEGGDDDEALEEGIPPDDEEQDSSGNATSDERNETARTTEGGEGEETAATDPSDRPAEPLGPRSRAPIAVAFVVSEDGHVLTSARAARCASISVGALGKAEMVALDRDKALALLKLPGAAGRGVVRLSQQRVETGDSIIAAGHDAEGPSHTINGQVIRARRDDRLRVAVPSRENDGGAPLFDDRGQVIGVLLPISDEASNERFDPRPAVRSAIGAEAIESFLSAQGVDPGRNEAGREPDDVSERARRATLPVFCR